MNQEEPLLQQPHQRENDESIQPKRKSERLVSLDVMRGITIALMIFVDFCGESTPAIDHAPWDGVKLADFVMPSFDFIVGISLVKSMQSGRLKQISKWSQLKTAFYRSLKLFVIGMVTQAGTSFPTYDLKHLRIMGILQRVSLCYLVVAISEILLPKTSAGDVDETKFVEVGSRKATASSSHINVFFQRRWHWLVAAILVTLHSILIYGVDDGCGLGIASPKCNGASYIDRQLLGVNHMYFPTNGGAWEDKEITFQRTHDCSTCAPGRCAPPPDAPDWCGYESLEGGHPFDPEGLVSSLTAVVAPIFGAHCGAATLVISDHWERMRHWGIFGFVISVIGVIIHFAGLPLNTDLYSFSYLLLSTGVCMIILCVSYFVVDYLPSRYEGQSAARHVHPILRPFHWLGLNSIFIYLLSCTGITETVLTCVYWNDPDHNLSHLFFPTGKWWGVDEGGDYVPEITHYPSSKSIQICCWCLFFYIPVWMILAGYLHSIKWYLKV